MLLFKFGFYVVYFQHVWHKTKDVCQGFNPLSQMKSIFTKSYTCVSNIYFFIYANKNNKNYPMRVRAMFYHRPPIFKIFKFWNLVNCNRACWFLSHLNVLYTLTTKVFVVKQLRQNNLCAHLWCAFEHFSFNETKFWISFLITFEESLNLFKLKMVYKN